MPLFRSWDLIVHITSSSRNKSNAILTYHTVPYSLISPATFFPHQSDLRSRFYWFSCEWQFTPFKFMPAWDMSIQTLSTLKWLVRDIFGQFLFLETCVPRGPKSSFLYPRFYLNRAKYHLAYNLFPFETPPFLTLVQKGSEWCISIFCWKFL